MAYIPGTNGNDDLYSGRNADYLDGGAGDDTLVGNGGDDTLEGGKGNDSLEGGSGADTFVYALGDGNDTITDYDEEDIIKFTSGTPKPSKKGNNIIFTVGSGSQKGTITVLNALKDGKIVTYIDADAVEHKYNEPFTINGTKLTLSESYSKKSFNITDYGTDYEDIKTIDASAIGQDISITGNDQKNVIIGGEGNDTLIGGAGNDNLTGGDGADVFVWNKGDGNDKITDYANEDKISINGTTVKKFAKSGNDLVLRLASGDKITVVGGAEDGKFINYTDDNGPATYPKVWEVNEKGTSVSLLSAYSADSFDVTANEDFGTTARTIDASAVDHDLSITGNKQNNVIIGADGDNVIDGGKGKDKIYGGAGNNTLIGGAGNDTLTGGEGDNVFEYANGDGNDVITNYKSGDVIQLTSGTVRSAVLTGNDYVFTVGKGKITVKDAKNKYIQVADADGNITWYPDPPDDGFTYSNGTVTLKKKYVGDTFDVSQFEDGFAGKVYTIDASRVKHDMTIIANKEANEIIGTNEDDYIDGAAGKDTISGGDGNDTVVGGKGNDNLSGGDGADVFVWNKGDGNDKITDYTNEDTIQIVGSTVTTVNASGDNLIMTIGKNKITIVGGADKVISYTDDEHPDGITYPEVVDTVVFNKKGTAATILAEFNEDEYNFADNKTLISLDASAVTHDISITGNKKANNIIGSDGADTINGGKGNDTIAGGKGNDKLYGGSGADVFVWNKGDGKDKILDYDSEDSLVINGDTYKNYSVAKNGEDIILNFTSSGKKITITGGADKVISGTDDNGEFVIGSPIVWDEDHTSATLTAGYSKDSFDSTDYSEYVDTLATINASQVTHDLTIIANKNANRIVGSEEEDYIDGGTGKDTIYGGDGDDTLLGSAGNDKLYGQAGNDSLWGGAGTDTLTGGEGADTFVFYGTDGKNTITDYDSSVDTIVALSGNVALANVVGDDVIFKVGSGQITVQNGRTQYTEVVDSSGNRLAWRNSDRS